MSEEKFSESDLCAEARTWLEAGGWIVHPEVLDWDLVAVPSPKGVSLSPPPGWRNGDVLGIQAKLNANADVLWQTLNDNQVPWRAVLVRRSADPFIQLAKHLGFGVLVREKYERANWNREAGWTQCPLGLWVDFTAAERQRAIGAALPLPPIVTDRPAGVRSPQQLTPWRVRALRLCRILRARGWVTSSDFKACGIDYRRWIDAGWLTNTGESAMVEGSTRPLKKMAPGTGLPDIGWEKESEALAAVEQKEQK